MFVRLQDGWLVMLLKIALGISIIGAAAPPERTLLTPTTITTKKHHVINIYVAVSTSAFLLEGSIVLRAVGRRFIELVLHPVPRSSSDAAIASTTIWRSTSDTRVFFSMMRQAEFGGCRLSISVC